MSILENIQSRQNDLRDSLKGEKSLADLIEAGLSVATGQGLPAPKDTKKALEAATGWVYACVDAISNEIASITLRLFKLTGNEQKEILEHDLLNLLYRANNATTKFDLFYLTQQYLELAGEAPWYLLKDKSGKPVQIILLRPDRISIIPGNSEKLIGGYKYKIYGVSGYEEITFEPEEIVFLKNPDPTSPFRGKGTLAAVMDTFNLDERAEQYNRNLFDNAATPSLILSTDKKITRDVMERLKAEISHKYEGVTNAHKTMILEGGMKADKLSLTNAEMQFIEQQKMSRDKILAIFRVPRTVLGITDDVNRANAEATDYVFAKRTIKPKMQRLIEQLNEFLVPMFDTSGSVYLDYDDPIPQSTADNLAKAEKGITGRFITPNEARAFVGLNPIDGGDELPESPVAFSAPAPQASFNPNNNKIARTKYSKGQKTQKIAERIYKTLEENITAVVYNSMRMKAKKKVVVKDTKPKKKESTKPLFDNEDQKLVYQKRLLTVSDDFEPKVIGILDTIFNSQSKEMVDALPSSGKINIPKVLLDAQEQKEVYLERLSPVMGSLISEQSKLAQRLLGIDPNKKEWKEKITRFSDVTQKFIAKKIAKMAVEVVGETNYRLKREIKEGIEKEESIPQIATRIRDVYNSMKENRSKVIARTEVSRATNFATLETYKESGVVVGQEWLATLDERTDECCASLNGKVIGLNKNWFQKGDSYLGLDLDYENVEHPPLHPNCRCTLIPVIR